MKSLQGQMLISGGGLFDPNFRHTVVLIGEHRLDGAVGVVLNRRLEVSVERAVPPLTRLVGSGEPLYEGGPVQPDQPVFLTEMGRSELLDVPIFGSVGFVTGEVSMEVAAEVRQARIFAGHAGWGAGQLEAEIEEGSWILEPARAEDVFTDAPDLLWHRILERKGPEYHRLSRMPFDPSMN